jgi:phosphatidylinositol glycan class B
VLVTHSAVAHKEYRFIYPAVVLLVMLAGLGIADVIARLQKKSQPSARAVAIAGLILAALSLHTWNTAQMSSKYNGALPAFRRLSVDSSVCGVGLRGYWFWSGGYTNLHRNVPIVPVEDDSATAASSAAFNVLVTIDGVPGHPAGFALERCWGYACIYRRAGGCLPDPAREINAYLRATGQ